MRRQILSLLLLPLLLAGCSTPGTFFMPLQGPHFKAQPLPDEDNALVYLYRPQSDWGDQELEAPGVFLNNELIGVLPSGGYLALEFDVDNYRLEMRRPLFGSYWTLFADGPLEFTRIASFTLEAETGAVYYLRYDELNPPPAKDTQPEEGDGPLPGRGRAPGSGRAARHPAGAGQPALCRRQLRGAAAAQLLGGRGQGARQYRHLMHCSKETGQGRFFSARCLSFFCL